MVAQGTDAFVMPSCRCSGRSFHKRFPHIGLQIGFQTIDPDAVERIAHPQVGHPAAQQSLHRKFALHRIGFVFVEETRESFAYEFVACADETLHARDNGVGNANHVGKNCYASRLFRFPVVIL